MTELVIELNKDNAVTVVIPGKVVPEQVVEEQVIPSYVIPAVVGQLGVMGEVLPDREEIVVPERIIPSYIIPETVLPDVVMVDWRQALKYAAMELQGLNAAMAGSPNMPRPLSCNPDAEQWVEETTEDVVEVVDGASVVVTKVTPAHWEGSINGYLGDWNGIPSDDGMVLVRIDNYDWINFKFLPAMPTQFNLIGGKPIQAGTII